MTTFVSDLEPQSLWGHFDHILTVPRRSRHEEALRADIISRAEEADLEWKSDERGNLVVIKPAGPGGEGLPVTVLQAHLDMVTVQNEGVGHDFDHDPIMPRREGDWIYATGTSLGADNGIGVAAMLALMDETDLPHASLELLFTLDEETGLNGVLDLGTDLLEGERLFNLDSEEEDEVAIGCAGAGTSRLTWAPGMEAGAAQVIGVKVRGLKGGHSGMDIHLGRGNALKILARALAAAPGLRVVSLAGGESHNAIPREAKAEVLAMDPEAAKASIRAELEAVAFELAAIEPGLGFSVEAKRPAVSGALSADASARLIAFLDAAPHGVVAMSPDIEGLVETSSNLARVTVDGGAVEVFFSSRSSIDSALRAQRRRIAQLGSLVGAEVEENRGYPGWKPNPGAPILELIRKTYAEHHDGEEPHFGACHAGLECGVIGAKYPQLDMASIGPTIQSPHSPDERVLVPSVGRFYRLLKDLVCRA